MDVLPSTATPPAMRSPERWLAVLRIAVGVWFAKAIFTKLSVTLAWGFLPVPTASDRWQHLMPVLVTKYAEGNPIGFFKEFLLNSVVPNSRVRPAHRVRRSRGRSGARIRMLYDARRGDWIGAGRELWSRGAVAGVSTAGVPLHADHHPGGDSGRARGEDLGAGRIRPLPHGDGRNHLARLGVDHRHGVGAPIGRIEPPSIRREGDPPGPPPHGDRVDHDAFGHVHDADARSGAFRDIG